MFESPTIFKSTTPFEDMENCESFEDVTAAFVGALHAEKPSGITPEMLAMVWRIDNKTANRTVKVTTQLSIQDANTSISRNFGTNNRILRYRSISLFFYTAYLFVTKKSGCCKASSSRLFTCM